MWHHRNNLSADTNGVIWRKRSSTDQQLQLLIPKAGRQELFLAYHASLFGGHLGRTCTLARLSHRFYWSGMADDVGDWLRQCTVCMKRKSPTGRHHPLGNIPTGHTFCKSHVGDELHVLFECEHGTIKNMNTTYHNEITKISNQFHNISNESKLNYILGATDKDIIPTTSEWLTKINQLFK